MQRKITDSLAHKEFKMQPSDKHVHDPVRRVPKDTGVTNCGMIWKGFREELVFDLGHRR